MIGTSYLLQCLFWMLEAFFYSPLPWLKLLRDWFPFVMSGENARDQNWKQAFIGTTYNQIKQNWWNKYQSLINQKQVYTLIPIRTRMQATHQNNNGILWLYFRRTKCWKMGPYLIKQAICRGLQKSIKSANPSFYKD